MVVWYILSSSLSLIITGFLFNFFGQVIAENPTIQSNEIDFVALKIIEFEKWFSNISFWYKALFCIGIALIIALLVLACKLDDILKKLPAGDILENIFGSSPFEDREFLRLLPGIIFSLYIFIRFGIGLFYEQANFDIEVFSFFGDNYSIFQWITQIFYFFVMFAMVWIIFDSFLSAGFIGGVIHAIFITTANLLMLFLGFILGVVAVMLIILAIVVIAVVFIVKLIMYLIVLFV